MGKTLVIFRITAADIEKIGEIEKSVRAIKSAEFRDLKRIPIGFGIEVINAAFLIPEKEEDALEKLTSEIEKLPDVESVEVEGMTLV